MIKEYGYEYDAVLDQEIWEETKDRVTDQKLFGAICLRSGRDALKAIAREYEPCTVLIPALACDSMIWPFEKYGHKIVFYGLNQDYSIDLKKLPVINKRCLFLYMDYFGKPSISDEALEELRKKKDFVFIEDRTHNLIWERKYSFQPEYVVASLRKWIPIPDGGLLWGKVTKPLESDLKFSVTRLKAQCMRHEFLERGDENIKKNYRQIFSTVSDLMDDDEPCRMSAYAYAIAKTVNWESIKRMRKENAKVMIEVLSESPHVKLIQDKAGYSDLYVAFMVANRDEIQRRLSTEGIFNTIIWPLADEQKKVCIIAKNTEETMLAAPCDQRYSADDVKGMSDEIIRVIKDVNGYEY